jgi:hypothetical protein
MSKALELIDKHTLILSREYQRLKSAHQTHEATQEQRQAYATYRRALSTLNGHREKFNRKRHQARQLGIEFTLTIEDYINLIDLYPVCPVFGVPLDYSIKFSTETRIPLQDNTPALDRIDNNKGYIPGNCWFISNKANRMKTDASLQELEQLVTALRRLTNESAENFREPLRTKV